MRVCENCQASIDHKRRDARFCDRACKMAHWHSSNRATDDGKARERERNRARYKGEALRRRAGAIDYYYRTQQLRIEYAREWRAENPHRRREQAERRAELMVGNRDFCPFGRAEWEALLRRFDFCCAYCGDRPSEPLHKDHVIPLSKGGRHAIANIVPACADCNRHKADLLLVEWRLRPTYPRR